MGRCQHREQQLRPRWPRAAQPLAYGICGHHQGFVGFQLFDQALKRCRRCCAGDRFAKTHGPRHAKAHKAFGEIQPAAAVEQHQLQPPFNGHLNIALQRLGRDPASVGQLKPTAIAGVAVGVAEKDQGIPGATRIEGRFQRAEAGLLTAVDLKLDLPSPFERLQLLQFLLEIKTLLLADPHQ